MDNKEAIELMKNEVQCIKIADKNNCNRECAKCELVKPTGVLLQAFDLVIETLEKQIPKKAIIIDENEDETEWKCPCCGIRVLEEKPESNYCQRCGTRFDWEAGE